MPHIWQPTSRLSPQPTSLLRLLLCARLGSARSGPHRRLNYLPSRFSIIILFFCCSFCQPSCLTFSRMGPRSFINWNTKGGLGSLRAHTRTRACTRPDILISRPTPARYTVHDSEYIGLALNYRPQAPTTVLLFASTAFTSLAINCTY